jgi:hypothetical protein
MMRLRAVLSIVATIVAAWVLAVAPVTAQEGVTSNGLGVDRESWNALHGPPGNEMLGFVDYERGTYNVMFLDERVRRLERKWGDARPVTFEAARAESVTLIPSDSSLIETYTARGDRTVDLYVSPVLAELLPSDLWTGGEPGNLIVIYRTQAPNKITSIVMATGNNP